MKDNCTKNNRRNVHVNTLTDMKNIIFENNRLKKDIAELVEVLYEAKAEGAWARYGPMVGSHKKSIALLIKHGRIGSEK